MKRPRPQSTTQPQPDVPGLTRRMVKAHARKLFRDVLPQRPLTLEEWRLVELDLARSLERAGL